MIRYEQRAQRHLANLRAEAKDLIATLEGEDAMVAPHKAKEAWRLGVSVRFLLTTMMQELVQWETLCSYQKENDNDTETA